MEHKNLILSITSALTSIGGFASLYVTKSNVGWAVGMIAGIYSIYCSYLTHKKLRTK